VSEQEVAP